MEKLAQVGLESGSFLSPPVLAPGCWGKAAPSPCQLPEGFQRLFLIPSRRAPAGAGPGLRGAAKRRVEAAESCQRVAGRLRTAALPDRPSSSAGSQRRRAAADGLPREGAKPRDSQIQRGEAGPESTVQTQRPTPKFRAGCQTPTGQVSGRGGRGQHARQHTATMESQGPRAQGTSPPHPKSLLRPQTPPAMAKC